MGHMYVGSVLRSMFTMLQVATFDKWAESVARPLFHVAPMATPVLFVCIFVMSFGTLNILVAVMVERISVITADRRTHAEQARVRMEAYMLESMVDDLHANDKDGKVHTHFTHNDTASVGGRIPGLVKKLGLLGITIEEAESLFEIMDVNHSGTVTPEEFIAGLQKIKGQAKGPISLSGDRASHVVRSAQYVSRMKFLNMQVDHVQERLNASGISLQFESGDRIKTAERNEMVTTSAAHRELLLFKLDAERQSAYPVVQDVRPGIDDDYDWS
eukprot:g20349.t1